MKKIWIILVSLIIALCGGGLLLVAGYLVKTQKSGDTAATESWDTDEAVKTIEIEEAMTETVPETEEETVETEFEYDVADFKYMWDTTGIWNQPYLVAVNRALNTVTVFSQDPEGNYTVPERVMLCSTSEEHTPLGTFTTKERHVWCEMVDDSWGRYAIRIQDAIMFHSVCYTEQSEDKLDYEAFNKLGSFASLGCIRLSFGDEMWLYENCPYQFPVVIYDDPKVPGPLGKPEQIIIDEKDRVKRGWDPTNPDPNSPWNQTTEDMDESESGS